MWSSPIIVRAYGIHKKQSWLLPTRLLHITRTDENQIPAVLILITYLKVVSGCVFRRVSVCPDAIDALPDLAANTKPVGAHELRQKNIPNQLVAFEGRS